jgi:hypothetical protein
MPLALPAPAPTRTYVPWGSLAAIDLHGCARARLADPGRIRAFVPEVIAAIGMKAHGPLALERFGSGDLEGWSAMQCACPSAPTARPGASSWPGPRLS